MHLILTGATGLVGSSVLDAMLKNKAVSKISVLSRRPVPLADDSKDPRVRVILHKNFEVYGPELLDQLQDAEGCVWALGTSSTNVNADQYVKITKDYALAAADAFSTLKSSSLQHPFRFIYVSGEGATHNPGRFSPIFARVKGETEQLLGKLSEQIPTRLRADSMRPGYVDPAMHPAIQPYIPVQGVNGFFPRMGAALSVPVFRYALTGMHSPTERLGTFLADMAMGKVEGHLEGPGAFRVGGGWVVQNKGMKRILGLDS